MQGASQKPMTARLFCMSRPALIGLGLAFIGFIPWAGTAGNAAAIAPLRRRREQLGQRPHIHQPAGAGRELYQDS
jgi:hypothetical protein